MADTRKNVPPSANKGNIPPYPNPDLPQTQGYVYRPTMVTVQQFDQKFKLPKQRKVSNKALKKAEERKKTKAKLIEKLAESDEKMKMINKSKTKTN